MSETDYTSFEPSTFISGGGTWADSEVEITGSQFVLERWIDQTTNKPKIDPNTGKPYAPKTMWEIKGVLVDADEPKERRELLSVGNGFEPSLDGMGLAKAGTVSKDKPYGEKGELNENTASSKFLAALHATGFPFTALRTADGKPYIAGLVGAVLFMKAEQKIDFKTGKGMVDDRGYPKNSYFPAKYIKEKSKQGSGKAAGKGKVGAAAPVAPAEAVGTASTVGVATSAAPAMESPEAVEAIDTLMAVLMAKDGSVNRGDLSKIPEVKAMTQGAKLLLIKESFLKAIPGVKYENGVISVA